MSLRKKRLLLLSGSILLPLLLAETWFRVRVQDDRRALNATLVHQASRNPKLVYEHRPGLSRTWPGSDASVVINAAGFRDGEFSVEKRPGVFRIIALGDSVTIGWQVRQQDTYTEVLERGLAGRAEVYNMAVTGYNTIQEVETLRTKGLRFDPDLVIIGYVHNDNTIAADGGYYRYFSRGFSRLWDDLKIRVARLKRKFGRSVTEEGFSELESIAKPRRLPVLIVIFPILELDSEGAYPHTPLHDEVRRVAAQHGFLVLDLLDAMRKVGMQELRCSPNDKIHLNDAGHKVAAAAIRDYLMSNAEELELRGSDLR